MPPVEVNDLPVIKDAAISACGRYRYWLTRTWDATARPALFVMLNPSTADAANDDRTIGRCVEFARSWNCGGIRVVNLFAWRATDPAELVTAADPVGPENDFHVRQGLEHCHPVVAAWGTKVPRQRASRIDEVMQLLRESGATVKCLDLTVDDHPKHPLYVAGGTPLTAFPLAPRSSKRARRIPPR